MTKEEEKQVKMLRFAGCKCEIPLLGYIPGQGPRCRMCGIEYFENMDNKSVNYSKYNDRSLNSSTYHKKDGTNIREKLNKR